MIDIYSDIAKRTDGDIYIGVVGPVRTGKSTFIKRFMEVIVLPNIGSDYKKGRAVDELPQSAGGRTIMTTEPKFIPEEAVEIELGDNSALNVRMIDCVGYIVPSALGYIEDESPRMVMTPWFDDEIPFNMAAEIGTKKVIEEHSTIGLVITTDGSISDIPASEYQQAEERVVGELRSISKPFVIIMNCTDPDSEEVKSLCRQRSEKYQTAVIPVNCLEMNETEIKEIILNVLMEFPVREIDISFAGWVNGLDCSHWLRKKLFTCIRDAAVNIRRMSDAPLMAEKIEKCEEVSSVSVTGRDLGRGCVTINMSVRDDLFYRILGETTGVSVESERDLIPLLSELSRIRKKYEKIASALEEVDAAGYGIVMPDMDELTLEEPKIIKQGGKYGVRLKASAPSLHIMKTNISTIVSPIVGSEKQSEDLVMYLMQEFEENPSKIWESNIFGKSLHELVNEGLHSKLVKMPAEARMKLQETLERVINEGCSGLICLIL